MRLLAPVDQAWVGGRTRLQFTSPPGEVDFWINGENFSPGQDAEGLYLDLNELPADTPLNLQLVYMDTGEREEVVLYKPRHDLGGMGATVIRNAMGEIIGAFFKFWLPQVREVYIRGRFNAWQDTHRLSPLGESGYWYGFVPEARPGDDYRFFVYGNDGNFTEVSDPAARDTWKTRHNEPDAQDANAVIIDPQSFVWRHDPAYRWERRSFSRHLLYQAHWGTFFRQDAPGDPVPERFIEGDTEEEHRQSVQRKLRYIRDLGFTALQLLPIHEANGNYNAGYDPSFFFAVETAYGQPYDLRILVDEAHGLGLAVFFDAVINHLTNDATHASFSQEFLRGWYTRENAPWSNHNQWGEPDWGPDPDYDRPEIRNLLTDCIRMYVDEFHVDGVRFDATTTIPRHALQDMLRALNSSYAPQGIYFIAEHITPEDPAPYIVEEIGFNAYWNSHAWYTCAGAVLGPPGRGRLEELCQVFEDCFRGMATTSVKYLLGSHDQIWSDHGGYATVDRWGGGDDFYAASKMRLGWALNVCALGTPMLFMGTEYLENRAWDEYWGYNSRGAGRPGLVWKEEPEFEPYQKLVQAINRIRLQEGALRADRGQCQLVHRDEANGVVGYKRWDLSGSVVLVLINISDNQWEDRQYKVSTGTPGSRWREVFNSQDERFGGWAGSGNAGPFIAYGDETGVLSGVNLPKWSLLVWKWVGEV